MKWKANFKAIKFDLDGYKKTLHTYMLKQITEAAKKWLHATYLAIIPTWSRASRATFQALASSIGETIQYGPQRSRKDRTQLGRSTGKGGLLESEGKFRWHFYYQSTLRYLAYNEYNSATPGAPPRPFATLRHPTPYHFQEAGATEFKEFARYVRLPNPLRFLKTTAIT